MARRAIRCPAPGCARSYAGRVLVEPDGASANTPTDLERSDVSRLFLYEGPNGLSLVVIHDEPGDGSGGRVTFDFSGLPDSGAWVVPDDPFDSHSDDGYHWRWVSCCTDGGAFRGGLDDSLPVTIEPTFHDGIDRWEFLSGDPRDPDVTILDRSESVTISLGGADISTSVTIASFLAGSNENSSELPTFEGTGHPLDSAQLEVFRPGEKLVYEYDPNPYTNTLGIKYRYEVDVTPVLDNWLTGDMVVSDELGDSLDAENALEYDGPKYEEAPGEVAKKYTLRNDVQVAFDTNSYGTIDHDSVSVTFDGASTPTVPEGEEVNNLDDDLETNSDGTIPGGYRPRFYNMRVTDDAAHIPHP